MEPGMDAHLLQRVEGLLARADAAYRSGEIDDIAALCAFPVAIVMQSSRRVINNASELQDHLKRREQRATPFRNYIWYADIVSIDPLSNATIDCKLNTHLVDENGHHADTVRQTLILVPEGEALKMAAIINPARPGFWFLDETEGPYAED